jgi:hypothetical protein
MTRHVRSWAIAALAVFALAGAATPSLAEIIYNVTNYADGQSGWKVSGTITVSGVGTYENDVREITAWNITAKKGLTNWLFANDAGDSPSAEAFGTIEATPSELLLHTGVFFRLFSKSTSPFSYLLWGNGAFGGYLTQYTGAIEEVALWDTAGLSPVFSPVDGSAWVVAAVPEIDPATGCSALSLVAGVLAMIEQRRRRATLVA